MGRTSRCKKCQKFISSIETVFKYGDHGWKFSCCGNQYYKCNRSTCSNPNCHVLYLYQDSYLLDKHIKKYHTIQEEVMTDNETNISDSSDDNMNTNTIHTSYEESSSMDKYFKENCSNDCTFPPIHQRNAIKKVITMACTKKEQL